MLVAGGFNGGALTSAELYDPATGSWTATAPSAAARGEHGDVAAQRQGTRGRRIAKLSIYLECRTVRPRERELDGHGQPQHRALWSHGDVAAQRQTMMTGGQTNGVYFQQRAKLYDPASGTCDSPRLASAARSYHTATFACLQQVLSGRGWHSSFILNSAELYEPASGSWTVTGSLNTAARCIHGDVAAQRQGAGGRGDKVPQLFYLTPARNCIQSRRYAASVTNTP